VVKAFGRREGKVAPRKEERIDIKAKAPKAPRKTVRRGCLIDRIAAIRNVLSPISEAWVGEGRGEVGRLEMELAMALN